MNLDALREYVAAAASDYRARLGSRMAKTAQRPVRWTGRELNYGAVMGEEYGTPEQGPRPFSAREIERFGQ